MEECKYCLFHEEGAQCNQIVPRYESSIGILQIATKLTGLQQQIIVIFKF
jgi:hypothetical protein